MMSSLDQKAIPLPHSCLFVCLGCGLASAPLLIPPKCLHAEDQISRNCEHAQETVLGSYNVDKYLGKMTGTLNKGHYKCE